MAIVPVGLLLILTGSLAYCALVIFAAHHYLTVRPPELQGQVPISILKPLAGADEGLEENLRGFFLQDYPAFELLFAVRNQLDPALAIVEKLRREHPNVPARVLLTGEPPYANDKVYKLDRMADEARYDLLVMSDSDIRVTPGMLRVIAAEFQDERLGVATCPYRAVPGISFWSTLEAVGMNTEFLAGVLTARVVEGMKFAVGPTMVMRKAALQSIGGFDSVKDYTAEDFVLGKLAFEKGWRVILSSYVIEHRIGSDDFRSNFQHRLRWARTTRRSRPAGYVGEVFTNPLPIALLLVAFEPGSWPLLALALAMRAAAAWAVAGWVLHDPLSARRWWLVPVQDLVSFAFWLCGFFGNTVIWRGRKFFLRADGKCELRDRKRISLN
jgi:ceramide glucosyltransferase